VPVSLLELPVPPLDSFLRYAAGWQQQHLQPLLLALLLLLLLLVVVGLMVAVHLLLVVVVVVLEVCRCQAAAACGDQGQTAANEKSDRRDSLVSVIATHSLDVSQQYEHGHLCGVDTPRL
jgi:hypothetical protein